MTVARHRLSRREVAALPLGPQVTKADFPDAPRGSWISDEGWLVVGDEAWTEREWATRPGGVGLGLEAGRPVVYDDEHHRKDREKHRRYNARRRAAA